MQFRLHLIAACAAGLLTAGLVLADKPDWAGHDRHEKKEKKDKKDKPRNEAHESWRAEAARAPGPGYFDADLRRVIVEYYGTQARAGKCPPGLAKKHNGCQPPGQAKKWMKGQPLPAGVSYVALPPDLLRRLPPPPPNHRYVQIAGDILLIAVGTSLVIDAVEDLFR